MLSARYKIRNVEHTDLDQLMELEKEWPADLRASAELLTYRIKQFQEGFFIAEDESGIIASIIAYPYLYNPNNLSHYANWEYVVKHCYNADINHTSINALYILSGTSKQTRHGGEVFDDGVNHVVELGKRLNKHYIVAGCLLPGYARYIQKKIAISAAEYTFKQVQGRYVDPLIERYRKLHFHVPNEEHIISNYYPHEPSLNYSALVVRNLSNS